LNKRTNKKKNVTVNDIAKTVGMSASTVSRALANHPKISKKSKEIIWKAAKKMGYLSNIPAYLQNIQTGIIIILIDDSQIYAARQFIQSAQQYMQDDKYQMLIKYINTNDNIDTVFNALSKLDIAGMISLLNNQDNYKQLIVFTKEYNIPLVVMHHTNIDNAYTYIIPDYHNGMSMMLNHLTKRAAKDIVLINLENSILADNLEKAFIEVLRQTNKFDSKQIVYTDNTYKMLKFNIEQALEENPKIDAFITSNYQIALQLHYLLRAKNYNIPDDFLICNFGNEDAGEFSLPKITNLHYSYTEMGKTAVKSIMDAINQKNTQNKLIVEQVKLIIKSSTMRMS